MNHASMRISQQNDGMNSRSTCRVSSARSTTPFPWLNKYLRPTRLNERSNVEKSIIFPGTEEKAKLRRFESDFHDETSGDFKNWFQFNFVKFRNSTSWPIDENLFKRCFSSSDSKYLIDRTSFSECASESGKRRIRLEFSSRKIRVIRSDRPSRYQRRHEQCVSNDFANLDPGSHFFRVSDVWKWTMRRIWAHYSNWWSYERWNQ